MLCCLTVFLLEVSKKCAATCAGSRLHRIRLLLFWTSVIPIFSSVAWDFQRKSIRDVHSCWRPCKYRVNMNTINTTTPVTRVGTWCLQNTIILLLKFLKWSLKARNEIVCSRIVSSGFILKTLTLTSTLNCIYNESSVFLLKNQDVF